MTQGLEEVEISNRSFGRSRFDAWCFSFLQIFVCLIGLLSWPLWPPLLIELFKEVYGNPSFTGVLLIIFWSGLACVFIWAPFHALYVIQANIRGRRLPFLAVDEQGVHLFFPATRIIAWSELLSVRWYTFKGVPRLGLKVQRGDDWLKSALGLHTKTIWIPCYNSAERVIAIVDAIRGHPEYRGERS